MRGRASPAKLLEALQAAVENSFDEGLKVETAISAELEKSVESRALRHLSLQNAKRAKFPAFRTMCSDGRSTVLELSALAPWAVASPWRLRMRASL
jgi:hypothetical protein